MKKTTTLTKSALALAVLLVAFANSAVRADGNDWLNAADGNFSDANNWSSGAAPTYLDDVIFNVGSASYTVSFDANPQDTNSLLISSDTVTFQFNGDGGGNGSYYSTGLTTIGDVAGSGGQLTLNGFGQLQSDSAVIADQAGSAGTVTIGDQNSTWTVNNALIIGNNGAGTLNLNAGTISSGDVTVGANAGATGSVSMSGGTWTANSLTIGNSSNPAANDIVTLSGGTFTFNNAVNLATSGVLNVDGGTLNAASLGGAPGTVNFSSGTINLQSDLTLDTNSVLGSTPSLGSGQSLSVNNLAISGGTVLSMNGGSLSAATISTTGGVDFSSGSVNVTGGDIVIDPVSGTFTSGDISLNSGDSLTASGNLIVGNGGNASLTLNAAFNSGGSASATNIEIGANGGIATVNVSQGSQLTASNDITVGGSGTGTLTDGFYGNVTATGTLHIYAGSEVDLSGGTLSTGALDAGTSGAGGQIVYNTNGYSYGSLTVQTGAVSIGSSGEVAGNFNLATNQYLGLLGGTVLDDQGFTLSGGQFQTGQITRAGSGQIVFNSGIITATGELGIGAADNAANQIASTVTLNEGSDIETTGPITIGTGGSVTMTGGRFHGDTLQVIGTFSYQTGDLNLTHGDEVIDNSSTGQHLFGANPTFASISSGPNTSYATVFMENVTIGGTGTGTATVKDGGELEASSRFVLGDSATGNGTLIEGDTNFVGGGGIAADQFIVGNYGTGQLTFVNGDITVNGLSIAAQPGSTGSVTIESPGGRQNINGILVVGGTYSEVSGTQVATAGGIGTYTQATQSLEDIFRLAVFGGSNVVLSGGDLGISYDSTFSAGATLTDDGHTFSSGSISNAGTLQGSGAIAAEYGYDTSSTAGDITNSGLIDANVSGQTLTLTTQGTGATLTNTGKLEASNGGSLPLQNLTINNSGGTILNNGGSVVITSSTVSGGTIDSAPGYAVLTSGSTELEGYSQGSLTNDGVIQTGNNRLVLAGTIINNGTISDDALGFGGTAAFKIGDSFRDFAELSGTGTLTMNESGSTISGFADGYSLTNDTQHTIEGQGMIENLHLINNGIIVASVSGSTLTIQNSTVTNAGLLEVADGATLQVNGITINNTGSITLASTNNLTELIGNGSAMLTGGGTVNLQNNAYLGGLINVDNTIEGSTSGDSIGNGSVNDSGGTIDANVSGSLTLKSVTNEGLIEASNGGEIILGVITNTGGTIEALDGSSVSLPTGSSIIGGTLATSGSGVIHVISQTNLQDLTNSGDFVCDNGSTTTLAGTINNTGSITVASTGDETDIDIGGGNVTLTGDGTVNLQNDSVITGFGTLTNDTQQTIEGQGTIKARDNLNLTLINNGTINANINGQSLTIETTTLTNTGTLETTNEGILKVSTSFINSGLINVTGNSVMNITGDLTNSGAVQITGGSLTISGNLSVGYQSGSNDTFYMSNGAQFKAGTAEVAAQPGSAGVIVADGSGTHFEANTLTVGGTASAPGGTGTFTLTSGATAHVATKLGTGTNGMVNVANGGGLTVGDNTAALLATAGNINVNTGGTLGGGGTINGDINLNGGIIAPGDPTTTTVNGDLTLTAGVLELAIAGPNAADSDHIDVNGMFSVAVGATLQLDFIDGFAPTTGETFDLISFQSLDPLNADFTHVTLEGLAPGFDYALTPVGVDGTTFQLTALNDAVPEVTEVPEPSPYALLLLGGGLLVLVHRRRVFTRC